MKKILIIIAALLLVFGLSACVKARNTDVTINSDNFTSGEIENIASVDTETEANSVETAAENAEISTTAKDDAIGGSDYTFTRRYIDDVYGIYILSVIRDWKDVQKFEEEVYLKQTYEEIESLPDLYQFIVGLNVTKEEFYQANKVTPGPIYVNEVIELLYCDDVNKMLEGLKSPYAFYWDGKVYTIYELYELYEVDKDSLLKIATSSENFEEYLGMMIKETSSAYPHIAQKAQELKAGLYK